MFKWGTVSEIDEQTGKVRVEFPDDDFQSWWLPILQTSTLGVRSWILPQVGAQAAVILDEFCEDGAVIGFRYSQADPPAVQSAALIHLDMGDGTTIHYDKGTKKLTATLAGDLEAKAQAVKLTAQSLEATLENGATIKAKTLNADISGSATIQTNSLELKASQISLNGAVSVQGPLSVSDAINVKGVPIAKHTHVCGGPGSTSGPAVGL